MEILFVLGFFLMLLVTGVSLLGVLAALVVATAVMFIGGLFALVIKLLPWLEQASNDLFSLLASGATKVEVPEQQKFPLREAERAHRTLESRSTQGSSLLIP